MSERSASLLAEALKLPAKEQGELIDGLLDALSGATSDTGDLTDDELAAELDRRAEEMRQDSTAGVEWKDVQHMR